MLSRTQNNLKLKIILLITVAIFTSFGLLACKDPTPERTDWAENTLSEAYDNNIITIEDIYNISYYLYGHVIEVADNGETLKDFTPTVDAPILDSKLSDTLKTAYYEIHINDFKNHRATTKDITITKYLGQYNKSYVCKMQVTFLTTPSWVKQYSIGNIQFIDYGTSEFICVLTDEQQHEYL